MSVTQKYQHFGLDAWRLTLSALPSMASAWRVVSCSLSSSGGPRRRRKNHERTARGGRVEARPGAHARNGVRVVSVLSLSRARVLLPGWAVQGRADAACFVCTCSWVLPPRSSSLEENKHRINRRLGRQIVKGVALCTCPLAIGGVLRSPSLSLGLSRSNKRGTVVAVDAKLPETTDLLKMVKR